MAEAKGQSTLHKLPTRPTQQREDSPSRTPALVRAVVHVAPISFNASIRKYKSFLAWMRLSSSADRSSAGIGHPSFGKAAKAKTVPALKAALCREGDVSITYEYVRSPKGQNENSQLDSGSGAGQSGRTLRESDKPNNVVGRDEALFGADVLRGLLSASVRRRRR
jgi:hypothetical protein